MARIFKQYVFPVVTLAGGIIGVGFLSLPYIALRVGLLPMIFYFIVLGGIVAAIHLIFGHVALHTPDHKRWPGFVGFYFGPALKYAVLLLGVLGTMGVLLSYLLIGGTFLFVILGPVFGGNVLAYVLLYFAAGSFFIYKGVKAISKFDFFAIAFLLVALMIIFISAFSHVNFSFFISENWKLNIENFFLPYGPIIFALWGTGIIPVIEEMIGSKKSNLKKIIVLAFSLIAVFYLSFVVVVLGISGPHTSDSALTGLKNFLSPGIFALALSIGIATTFIAFVAQGLLLKQVLVLDLKVKGLAAWAVTCFAPLALYFAGFHSFIPLISFIGGFLLGIDGILILLMYRKIGGRKIIAYPLMLIFMLGILYTVIHHSSP